MRNLGLLTLIRTLKVDCALLYMRIGDEMQCTTAEGHLVPWDSRQLPPRRDGQVLPNFSTLHTAGVVLPYGQQDSADLRTRAKATPPAGRGKGLYMFALFAALGENYMRRGLPDSH